MLVIIASACYAQVEWSQSLWGLEKGFRQTQKIAPRYSSGLPYWSPRNNMFYVPTEEGRVDYSPYGFRPFFWERKRPFKHIKRKLELNVGIEETFDDNIYQDHSDRESDFITTIPIGASYGPIPFFTRPVDNRGLSTYLGARFINYATHEKENKNPIYPGIAFREQGLFNGRADAYLSLSRQQELSRYINSSVPSTIWDSWNVNYGVRLHPNKRKKFFWNLRYDHSGYIFSKEESENNSETDTFSVDGNLRITPKTTISFGGDHVVYTYPEDESSNEIDDTPWVSITQKISRRLNAFLRCGYSFRRPNNSDKVLTGPVFNFGLDGRASRRFSWSLNGWQDAGRSWDVAQGSLTETGVSLGGSYSLSRRQTINGYASYYIDEYDSGRKDHGITLGLLTSYRIKKLLSLILGYRFIKEISSEEENGYYENTISLMIRKEFQ